MYRLELRDDWGNIITVKNYEAYHDIKYQHILDLIDTARIEYNMRYGDGYVSLTNFKENVSYQKYDLSH